MSQTGPLSESFQDSPLIKIKCRRALRAPLVLFLAGTLPCAHRPIAGRPRLSKTYRWLGSVSRCAAAIGCDSGDFRGSISLMNSLSRRGFLILGAASLLSACSSAGFKPTGDTTRTPPAALTTASITAADNGIRAKNGKPPLAYNDKLEAAARSQARLMASKDQLSHNLGISLRERVTSAGYEGAVGENVAGGQLTLEQAIDGWLASPKHRETLLSTKFTEFGLAVASVPNGKKSRYGIYWTFIAGGSFEPWKL